ncbi:cysteine proteinase [Stipitochalara longipes BDJ]|nr:cysteine proteinase [Stipitochalara longipes BDJ]
MSEQNIIYGDGYIPDQPDSRDKIFYKEIATTGVHTQAGFLEVKPIPNYNQQNLGSCTANAVALALRYGLQIHTKDKNTEFNPSRLFIWYWAKYLYDPNGVQYDRGCGIRNAIKSLLQQGCPPENLWPYPGGQVQFPSPLTKPVKLPDELFKVPNDATQAAKDYFNIKFQYFRIKDADDSKDDKAHKPDAPASPETSRITQIKSCIAEGYPVIFGIRRRQNWEPYRLNNCVDQGGIRVLKEPPTQLEGVWEGGHALVITGFNRDINRDPKVAMKDKLPGAFEVQNSWGDTLSRFYIPYSYFESEWVHDIWVIKIEGLLNDPHGTGKQWQ